MSKDLIETAMNQGIPFVINMGDGKQYKVSHRHKIAVGKTNVVVLDEKDLPHVLPLLTMTGLSYLEKDQK